MVDIYEVPLEIIYFLGLILIWSATEIGWRLGRRSGETAGGNFSTLESASFGLLALIMGFTFAMGLTRFEARRDAVVEEANAIGTTALRAKLLPQPEQTEVLKLLREYVQLRIDAIESTGSLATLRSFVSRSSAIQVSLWQQARAVVAKDNEMVPTGLFVLSLNEMIDDQGKRVAVVRNRVPGVVLLVLLAMAIVAAGFEGYASALDEKGSRLPGYIMGLLVCSVMILILDLDRPAGGFIRTDQQPMIDAAATLSALGD